MLVLLGPEFSGSDQQIAQLAQVTGLLPYDLRTRLRPGVWGVLRTLADHAQTETLVSRLRGMGFDAVAVDSAVGQDPERKIVYLRGMELAQNEMILRMNHREMSVAYGTLLTIVRGEVHLGRSLLATAIGASAGQTRAGSLSSWLPPAAAADASVVGDGRHPGVTDVFAAADLHFATVQWIARVDPRAFAFPATIPSSSNSVERLDTLAEWLAARAGVRIDRHLRVSSLGSCTICSRRMSTPPQSSSNSQRPRMSDGCDEYFDAYSRLVAEAERQYRNCPS
jgi:hypothetical protein